MAAGDLLDSGRKQYASQRIKVFWKADRRYYKGTLVGRMKGVRTGNGCWWVLEMLRIIHFSGT